MIHIQVLYQHRDFIAVMKPPGISVHKDTGNVSFVTALAAQVKAPQLYLVHRLDKLTSGVLLLARTAEVAAKLSALFRERKIAKYYLAFSDRKPIKKQGVVKGDMVKARRSAWKLSKSMDNPALTKFISRPIEGFGRIYLVRPYTGKTHQIRVAMKSLSASILGDPLYYSGEPRASVVADRMYLHAAALAFDYEGEAVFIQSLPQSGEWFELPMVKQQLTDWLTLLASGAGIPGL